MLRQRPDARWAVAGRNADKMRALVDEMLPEGARRPKIIVADTRDPESLRAMARQAKVVFNLAGPYHATGDAVVAACIEAGAHYLDLSAETFWMQRLVHEQHDAAQAARVKIMPCAGYEALPFDLANLWAATQLREQCGEPCASVTVVVSITGRPITSLQDLVSGGTAASVHETPGARPQRLPAQHGLPAAAGCARWAGRGRTQRAALGAALRRRGRRGAGADAARPLHQPAGGAAWRGADGRRHALRRRLQLPRRHAHGPRAAGRAAAAAARVAGRCSGARPHRWPCRWPT